MAFEEEFGGYISDEEAQKIVRVGDAVRFLDGEPLEDKPAAGKAHK